uniref:Uncharacterized protein n=1 Tax=Arabidopsis thaliana TaxID=3702 RepID=O49748_ARATH|nr:hypothetical protein [Arabidopsis thaliana]
MVLIFQPDLLLYLFDKPFFLGSSER